MKANSLPMPNRDEKQQIYKTYCQLVTIIHDYAVGTQLRVNNCFSWAIASNYYSLMHCGRFICLLTIGEYPHSHAQLIKFLKGDEPFNNFDLNDVISRARDFYIRNDLSEKIRKLGVVLEKIKTLREDNNYEFYIVSHQINHSFLGEKFPEAYEIIKKQNEIFFEFILKLFFAWVGSLAYKDSVISFLTDSSPPQFRWGFTQLKETFRIQKFNEEITEYVFGRINTYLRRFLSLINLESDFYEDIKFENFNVKRERMQSFAEHIEELRNVDTNE